MPELRRACFIALAAFSFIGGCSKTDSSAEKDNLASVVDEFDALSKDPTLQAQRWADRQNFVSQCMKDRGYDYLPVPWTAELAVPFHRPGHNLLTLSESDARDSGLGISAPVLDVSEIALEFGSPAQGAGGLSVADASYETELWGYVGGEKTTVGCAEKVTDAVGPMSFGEAIESIDMEAENEKFYSFINDAEVVDSFYSWSLCMGDAGYPGIDDPVAEGPLFDYFWAKVSPRSIEEIGADEENQADANSVREAEASFGVEYVRCIAPFRAILKEKWLEYLGY